MIAFARAAKDRERRGATPTAAVGAAPAAVGAAAGLSPSVVELAAGEGAGWGAGAPASPPAAAVTAALACLYLSMREGVRAASPGRDAMSNAAVRLTWAAEDGELVMGSSLEEAKDTLGPSLAACPPVILLDAAGLRCSGFGSCGGGGTCATCNCDGPARSTETPGLAGVGVPGARLSGWAWGGVM